MKLFTPDKAVLMDVSRVASHPDGLVIEGKIMGVMPMKAVLRPEELRAGLKLASWSTIGRAVVMLLRGGKAAA